MSRTCIGPALWAFRRCLCGPSQVVRTYSAQTAGDARIAAPAQIQIHNHRHEQEWSDNAKQQRLGATCIGVREHAGVRGSSGARKSASSDDLCARRGLPQPDRYLLTIAHQHGVVEQPIAQAEMQHASDD